ncbi:MAG: 2-phospho-L-lactate guanylyltransferase [Nocardioidaceae bacterium]|nr:2-phospho-L-lactate guanylyltransferase [Nocardioidaceae bacterium]
MPAAPRLPWSIIIPVKPVAVAKSRLTGISVGQRRDLALAFALDTTLAALTTAGVRRVVVVTDDPEREAFRDLGADLVADRPSAGLNAAIRHGADDVRGRDGECGLIALAGDLPALRPAELSEVLDAPPSESWFVGDAACTGTTLLAAAAGRDLTPAFGPGSAATHRSQGAAEVTSSRIERLRRDVDTLMDLGDALRLGVGAHTAKVVAGLDPDRLR